MYPISSPHFGQNTNKKTNTNSYKTNSQHTTPNLGPQVGLLKEERKKRFVETLFTYLPSSLFCYLLFSNLHSFSLVSLLSTTKVIEPHAHH
jgi:hypothetical protein